MGNNDQCNSWQSVIGIYTNEHGIISAYIFTKIVYYVFYYSTCFFISEPKIEQNPKILFTVFKT